MSSMHRRIFSRRNVRDRRKKTLLHSPRKVCFMLLTSIENDYIERIGMEHQYFEFVNTIRLLSREIFTKVNPEKGTHKIYNLLQELRDKLFFFDESFCSRFLNEEIRNSQFYEDGSALRHLA